MSGSSQGFCSTGSPMQYWPPLLGAGLLQLRDLDLWPPEHDPQEDQQLQLPWITPERKLDYLHCGNVKYNVIMTPYYWTFDCLPGCAPITAPFSQACPEVPGWQTHRHSEPVSSGWPLFWQGRQWQGCSSDRYCSMALCRWSFFKPAHCTSFTSSDRGCSWDIRLQYINLQVI